MAIDPFTHIRDVTGPYTLAAFAIAALSALVGFTRKDKTSRNALLALASLITIIALITIWLNPTPDPEPYRIHVLAVDSTEQALPIQSAVVFTTDIPGIAATVTGSGTEIVVNPAQTPADKRLTIYATVQPSFLAGRADVTLGADYNPVVHVKLLHNVTSTVSGSVEAHSQPVRHAKVWFEGHESESVKTNTLGAFTLEPHATEGETIIVHVLARGYLPFATHITVSDDLPPIRLAGQ